MRRFLFSPVATLLSTPSAALFTKLGRRSSVNIFSASSTPLNILDLRGLTAFTSTTMWSKCSYSVLWKASDVLTAQNLDSTSVGEKTSKHKKQTVSSEEPEELWKLASVSGSSEAVKPRVQSMPDLSKKGRSWVESWSFGTCVIDSSSFSSPVHQNEILFMFRMKVRSSGDHSIFFLYLLYV